MFLVAANMARSFLMVSKCEFGWIIIKLFEVWPPIIVVMLNVGPRSSEAVDHVYSKVVALMSWLHIFERFVNRDESLNQKKGLLVENLQFNHSAIDEFL